MKRKEFRPIEFYEYSKGMHNISCAGRHLGRMFEIGGTLYLVIDCDLRDGVLRRVGGFSTKEYLLEYMLEAVGDINNL